MEKGKFYITTPIFYANGNPHAGHAYTLIAADVLARFHRRNSQSVFFSAGMDEHGIKVQRKAEQLGKTPQNFVDEICKEFQDLENQLNISYDGFIRTTDEKHKKAVQKVLQFLYDKGAIYKGTYKGLYCIGCEQFLTESQLADGKCPDHGTAPEICEEESYLLKMGEIQSQLIEKIEKDEFKISPYERKNEILSFLKGQSLQDVAISRDKRKVSWGVELPFDKNHVTYVWVDAFLNYLTVLGWDGSPENIPELFPPNIQLVGKDILRVHATIWPVILLHLNVDLPKEIFAHGMIISGGKKMSKTLGNVVSPYELIDKFGVDATRYLLISAGNFGSDPDVAMERMAEKYNADLVNGIGNVVARVTNIAEKFQFRDKIKESFVLEENIIEKANIEILIARLESLEKDSTFKKHTLETFISGHIKGNYNFFYEEKSFNEILNAVLGIQKILDKIINEFIEEEKKQGFKPWTSLNADNKRSKDAKILLFNCLESIRILSHMIYPFMPETSEKIFEKLGLDAKIELAKTFDEAVKWGSVEFKNVKKGEGLFPRIKT